MTAAQFASACKRAGFEPEMLGYYKLPVPGHHICTNVLNAGPRLRDRLAYLHEQTDEYLKKYAGQIR
jgi:hypothetical protein